MEVWWNYTEVRRIKTVAGSDRIHKIRADLAVNARLHNGSHEPLPGHTPRIDNNGIM